MHQSTFCAWGKRYTRGFFRVVFAPIFDIKNESNKRNKNMR
jgi:hypothetical protein